ncbi:GAP family protein [Synechococcus sp. RSCCF101]|nr:GAP family protein [Synechococcus sp. RSCCF101]QEY33271.1 GAP family protein [Synechococcus sp. RSCCF101]
MSPDLLWSELVAYGAGISLSPVHIGVLLLLLVGSHPLRRAGWFLLGWVLTTALAVALLITVGHRLLLDMSMGTDHRTGLDLLAAGALLALGLKELLRRGSSEEAPGWTRSLERFVAMPIPLLLLLSAAAELISPDDLFLFAKAASALLAAGLSPLQETLDTALFTLGASALLLLPVLLVLLLGERSRPVLEGGRDWLFRRGDWLVGGLSLVLAGYLGWQGLVGLQLN